MTQIGTFATQIAIYGIVLGTVAFAACDSHPQAPTPLGPSQATPPPSARQPRDRGTNPGNNPLIGLYTLTLDIGSGCAVVPEAERTRSTRRPSTTPIGDGMLSPSAMGRS